MEIRAIRRATEILRCLATRPGGVSLTELAAAVVLSKTTTYRILQTLIATDFVTADPLKNLYFPGSVFLRLGLTSESFESLKRAARPHLEKLRDVLEETVSLVVMRGAERLNVDVALGLHELKAVPEIGSTKPIHAGAAGKALLAFLSENETRRLIGDGRMTKVARNTIESARTLHSALKLIRERGYARSAEETVNGQGAIAAPIIVNGAPIGAVNLSVPMVRLSEKFTHDAVPLVLKTARAISRALGQAKPQNSSSIKFTGSGRAQPKRLSAPANA